MGKRLFYLRPGLGAKMIARCQFGVDAEGRCGALMTYPIPGLPWRRNVTKTLEFSLSESEREVLFAEVARLRADHPDECLDTTQLWSDSSDKANAVTRDLATNTACVTLGIFNDSGERLEYFSMREDSPVLLSSQLFRFISSLVEPYEKLP